MGFDQRLQADFGIEAELTNPRAERVRQIKALATRAARRKHGNYLVEGPQGVREVIAFRPDSIREVFCTLDAARRYPEILAGAASAGVRLRSATPEVVAAMSPDAQGVLAVVRTSPIALADVLGAGGEGLELAAIVSNARDPGNVGTVIRAADAAGADAVFLAGQSVELHNPKLVRSTAGSLFHLPVAEEPSLAALVESLREVGLQILAADVAGDQVLFDAESDLDLARPTAWLFGNEAWGLSEADRALADHVVQVPIFGAAESLNLAMAATICLYASAAGRQGASAQVQR